MNGIKRPVAATVLFTFLAMVLQPLSAIAQDRPLAVPLAQPKRTLPWSQPLPQPKLSVPYVESEEERFSRTLNEVHEILKEVAPRTAMPRMFHGGKPGEMELRAIGPNLKIEVERAKPAPGVDVAAKVAQLRAKAKELASLEQYVRDGFDYTGKDIKDKNLPAEILARHEEALKAYEARSAEFKALLGAVERLASVGGETLQTALSDLAAFMAKHPHQKTHAAADPKNLPFGGPKPVTREPYTSPSQFRTSSLFGEPVRLAQAGSISGISVPSTTLPATPVAADTAPTEDVQISQAVRDLATSLNNNPVKIYNWVRNNIDFVPTYGSVQGSDFTLHAKRGNAFDTASLLIALLRAAGTPARYVYGTVEIPADKVMNWVGGMTVPHAAVNLMWQGGIPSMGITQSGQVRWIRLEHVWVEAFVDYIPSRGAVNRAPNTWVPLDAAFKQYATIPSLITPDFAADIQPLAESFNASASRSPDGVTATGFNANLVQAPIQAMQARLATLTQAHSEKVTLEEYIGGRVISESEPSILAGTLPYKVIATGARMSALPANLRVAAQIDVYTVDAFGFGDEGTPLLSRLVPLPSLRYGSLNLTHAPAMPQDAATWASYTNAGATSFPAYLINVKPRLSLDGVALAEGGVIRAGTDLKLKVSFSGAGQTRSVGFDIIAGDEIELGINGNGHSPLQGFALSNRSDLGTAAGNLFVTAKAFWTQQDFQEKLLAALQGVATIRLPSVGIFAAPISVVYSFGVAKQASYHSRQVDIKLMQTGAAALDGNARTATTFALHAGMIGSSTEGAVIEEVFSKRIGHGSNTTRLLQLANEQGIPIYHLRADSFAASRPALQHAPEVMTDIENALSAGLEVIIPQVRQVNGAWSGSGYIMIDPVTASADYRVSGALSGNFDADACQRSTEPVRVVLPDASIIWLVLFGWLVDEDFNFNGSGIATALVMVLAAVAIVAIVARGGAALIAAGTAVAVLTRVSFAAILLAVGGSAAADADDECACEARKIARKGGNQVHNACADLFTDSEFVGGDVKVGAKAFDGLRRVEFPPNGTLYEIKTGLFYSTIKAFSLTRPKLQGFLDGLKLRAIAGYFDERLQAAVCAYEFRYGTRDPALLLDMQKFFTDQGLIAEAARVFNSACP